MQNWIFIEAFYPWVILFLLLSLALMGVLFVVRVRALKIQKLQIEENYKKIEMRNHSLELESIKSKLNPHLFKNTLNSIQSHAYQTYNALDRLANVLDYILYESNQPFVSLKDEIDFALSLIEINRLKISPLFDLKIKTRVNQEDPLYEQRLIAPLITIDLIENAFKHADLQSQDAFISIVFELKDDFFSLTVANKVSPQPPIKKSSSGFGREGLKKRLSIIYKENYKLDQFVENDTYFAHLKINLLEHKTQMLTAR